MLPAPVVMTDSYVVLMAADWKRLVAKADCVPITTYTIVSNETYGRHVIVLDTLGL